MAAAVARGAVRIKDGLYLFPSISAEKETEWCRSDTFGRSQARSSTDMDTFAEGIDDMVGQGSGSSIEELMGFGAPNSSNGGGSGDRSSQQPLLGLPAPPPELNMISLLEKHNRLGRGQKLAEQAVRVCMSAGINCTSGQRSLQQLSETQETVEKTLGEVSFIMKFKKGLDGVAMTQQKVDEFEATLDNLIDCLVGDVRSARGYLPKPGRK